VASNVLAANCKLFGYEAGGSLVRLSLCDERKYIAAGDTVNEMAKS